MAEAKPVHTPHSRVLILENSLHMTGAFVSALELAKLLRLDRDVEFLLPSTATLGPMIESQGMVCHKLPMSEIGRAWQKLLKYVPLLLINTIRLTRILRRRNIQILVINDYYNLLGFMVRLTGWRGTILTFVRLMPFNQQPLLNKVWTALALWCSDKVLAVSKAVRAQLPLSHKVQVLYNPEYFVERLPAEIPIDSGIMRCLYLSNYIAGKGQMIGLKAFAAAYRANPSLRLRFVGGDMGLEKNRNLKKSLEQTAIQLGLQDVVSFEGYSNDVEREIKLADIVLNFSESESFSTTCLEACACGRPVIATRCGGPQEIIDDGVSGLLVPVGDAQAMTEAMLKLAGDAELRKRMGQAGSVIVRSRFSKDQFLAEFLPLCELRVT
jgi:L-malate glycosyltransferase